MNYFTLTTIPSRLCQLDTQCAVESLCQQKCGGHSYEVHMNIPHVHEYSNTLYVLPQWLLDLQSKYAHLKVYRTDDQGPNTKLVPTLQRITDPDALIIVCDDDLVQHPRTLISHIQLRHKYPKAAIGYDGLGVKRAFFNDHRDHFVNTVPEDIKVKILQAYKTISYKRSFFDDTYFSEFAKCSWNDDLLNSAYLASKKIDRVVVTSPFNPQINSYEEWTQKGGVCTFPVLRHTSHEQQEGCNVYRDKQIDDNSRKLYKQIDHE